MSDVENRLTSRLSKFHTTAHGRRWQVIRPIEAAERRSIESEIVERSVDRHTSHRLRRWSPVVHNPNLAPVDAAIVSDVV